MRADAVEAFANAAIGLVVSWAATFFLLPLWGLTPSASQSAGITAMFFGLSFVRAWMLRILFRNHDKNIQRFLARVSEHFRRLGNG